MKNLNNLVEIVWAQTDIATKLAAFKDLVASSHATNGKKLQTLRQSESYSMTQLDSLAINYAMAGEGLKVLK
jgi:hypothetical protein